MDNKPEKPEECMGCGYPTKHLTFYKKGIPEDNDVWLCRFCEHSALGNSAKYNTDTLSFQQRATLMSVAAATNVILDKIDSVYEDLLD